MAVLLLASGTSGQTRAGSDGGYDPEFASGGRRLVGVSESVDELAGMALRPNRKIVLAGACSGRDTAAAVVSTLCAAELNGNGAATDFGLPGQPNGPGRWLLTDSRPQAPGEEWFAFAFALDGSGRLLLAGRYNASIGQASLVRVSANGHGIDPPFLRVNGPTDTDPVFLTIAVDAAQRILLAGSVVRSGVRSSGMVLRLLPNLQLDQSFASAGTLFLDHPDYFVQVQRVAVDSQDRVVVLSSLFPSAAGVLDALQVQRFLADGQIDGSFNGSGRVGIDELDDVAPLALTIDSGDRILFAGNYRQPVENDRDLFIARLTPAGNFDPGIPPTPGAGAGVRLFELEDLVSVGPNELIRDLRVQSDGKIVLVGHSQRLGSSRSQFLTMRLLENADLDASYGVGGVSVGSFEEAPFPGFDDIGQAVAFDPIGGLLVAGTGISSDVLAVEDFGIARLFNAAAADDQLFADSFD